MARKSFAPLRTKFLTGLPFLIIAFLLVLFFYDVIFFGKTLSTSSLLPGTTPQGPYGFSGHRPGLPFSFDTAGNAWVNEPNPYIIRKVLDGGSLPVWNPYEGLGVPLIANMNNEVFNPLKLFLNLFPGPFAQDIFFLLRLLLMGSFTYLFLRERKLSPESSLFGASFFMLSGYSIWWINLHPLSTVMYLPAVFYFYERWSNRRELKSAFLMSLFLSFAIVSGKIPDVIIGFCLLFFYAIWKGMVTPPPTPPLKLRGGGGSYGRGEGEVRSLSSGWRVLARGGILGSMFREGGKLIFVGISGTLMAAIALLPFIELYSHASPLAKAIRTGSASHTIPLISSVSLVQPMFLGWGNYFYGSWLKWTPDAILPHAGIVIALFSLYAIFHSGVLKKTFPYFLFSLFLFFMTYGLWPSHIISRLPLVGSIGFLKYNAMFYFSLAVIAGSAFEHLLSEESDKKKFYLSVAIIGLLILTYFFSLYSGSPPLVRGYMVAIVLLSLSGIVIMGLALHFSKKRQLFGGVVFLFMICELFLYMPKDHPDRVDPYKEPPDLHVIKEESPYRFSGSGNIMPPLVSNALGLYDTRAISVLLPGDYYVFFENLLSFSVPQTNNPNPLFFATSPFSDLVGVKYVMSKEPLEHRRLDEEVSSHIRSLRLVRLFEAMINHTVEGGMTYGFFDQGGERRVSLFFPMRFAFQTKLRVSEPFIFTEFSLTDVPKGATAKVKVTVGDSVTELIIKDGAWTDQWLDLSRHLGKVITFRMEGIGGGEGKVVLGNFGLSPGYERERSMYNNLLPLHKKELAFLEYKGAHEGIHIYENKNVMDRAFVVHKIKAVNSLDRAIRELQEGLDFREIALVTSPSLSLNKERKEEEVSLLTEAGKSEGDNVVIKKYTPDAIAMEVNSKGGLLVLSDLYYPGWKVRVNGRNQEIVKAFGLLRGVLVGKGKSEILFYYRPMSLYAGFAISVITFVVWITFLIISRRKTRGRYLNQEITR